MHLFLFHVDTKDEQDLTTPPTPQSLLPGAQISLTHTHTKSRCRGAAGKISVCVLVGLDVV